MSSESKRIQIHLPIGRFVQGHLYEITDESKKKAEELKRSPQYYIALAIQKRGELSWKDTTWGKKIVDYAVSVFHNREYDQKVFSWKIIDGDDATPNQAGTIPVKTPGFKNCWVIKCSSTIPTKVYTANGTGQILDPDIVKRGDYLEGLLSIARNYPPANDKTRYTPGLYIGLSVAAFSARGERIEYQEYVDVAAVGFGRQELPAEAIPVTDVQGVPLRSHTQSTATHDTTAPMPAPHPAILQNAPPAPPTVPPAPPAAPVKHMTALATTTYEEYIKAGWTDELLVQHGFMTL